MGDGDLPECPMRKLYGVMKCLHFELIVVYMGGSIHFQTYQILYLRSVHFTVVQILPELKKKLKEVVQEFSQTF